MAVMKSTIRFADESLNTTHYFEAPADPKSLWYSTDNLNKFEDDAKEAGRQVMRSGLALLMEDTFAKPHPEAQESLNEFVKSGDARGVERVICLSHFKERKSQKAELLRVVFETQQMARKNDWHPSKLREKLRELSTENSFKAKLFARKMALADEAACYPRRKGDQRSSITHKPGGLIRRQSYENGRCSLAVFGCF